MTKKKIKSSKSIHTYKENKVVYESNSDSNITNNATNNNNKGNKNKNINKNSNNINLNNLNSKGNKNNLSPNTKQPIKRRPNDLLKLYEKEIINQSQYASGERLLLDYEISFKNKCSTNILDEVKVQKSTKMNNEFHLIQNLSSWDRYNKAMSSISDLITRGIVRDFIIEGKGLTEIDKSLGKRGVAEVRLWYGLRELASYYKRQNQEKQ